MDTLDHALAARSDAAPRRLLLVCAHFARTRHTGGIRWRALARDLTRMGWTLDVIAVDPTHPSEEHPGPPPEIAGVRLHLVSPDWWGQRARLGAARLLGRLRPDPPPSESAADDRQPGDAQSDRQPGEASPELPRPDRSLGAEARRTLVGATEVMRDASWARRALKVAREVVRDARPDVIVVTSPVHLSQRVGVALAEETGVPYLADFRDPLFYGRNAHDLSELDPVTRRVWEKLERQILSRAVACVDIAEGAQNAVAAGIAQHGLSAPPRHYIPNGYDPLPEPPARPDPEVFRVAYTGWLYPFMDVPALFAALGRFARRHGSGPERFRVDLMGTGETFRDAPLAALAAAHGIGEHLALAGRQPPEVADKLQQRAAVLVAYDSVVSGGLCIPTKLYFYARTYGDLLLLGKPEGAMAIEAAKIRQPVLDPANPDALDHALDRAFARWSAGDYPAVLDAESLFDSRRSALAMDGLLRSLAEARG